MITPGAKVIVRTVSLLNTRPQDIKHGHAHQTVLDNTRIQIRREAILRMGYTHRHLCVESECVYTPELSWLDHRTRRIQHLCRQDTLRDVQIMT